MGSVGNILHHLHRFVLISRDKKKKKVDGKPIGITGIVREVQATSHLLSCLIFGCCLTLTLYYGDLNSSSYSNAIADRNFEQGDKKGFMSSLNCRFWSA